MREPSPQTIYLKDYAAPAFLVTEVDLDIALFDEHAEVRARLALRRNPAAPDAAAPLRLDGDELEFVSAAIDGRALREGEYAIEGGQLVIPRVPREFDLATTVRIHPHTNTQLMGLYASQNGFFTQCEAEGFRRITFFPDRPDVMARYTTTIHADRGSCPMLLSNGNPVASGEEPGGRHWAKWRDPFPKPSYLFAMVAAKLDRLDDTFTTRSGRKVALSVPSPIRTMRSGAIA